MSKLILAIQSASFSLLVPRIILLSFMLPMLNFSAAKAVVPTHNTVIAAMNSAVPFFLNFIKLLLSTCYHAQFCLLQL